MDYWQHRLDKEGLTSSPLLDWRGEIEVPEEQKMTHMERKKRWRRRPMMILGFPALIVFTLCSFHLFHQRSILVRPKDSTSYPITYAGSHQQVSLNSTLGFQKVFVINMAEQRPDKAAEMAILGNQYNIEFEFVSGVRGKDIDLGDAGSNTRLLNEIGCHMAHTNVWTKMVKENLTSALILEDDVDFDENLRLQLGLLQGEGAQDVPFLHGSRYL